MSHLEGLRGSIQMVGSRSCIHPPPLVDIPPLLLSVCSVCQRSQLVPLQGLTDSPRQRSLFLRTWSSTRYTGVKLRLRMFPMQFYSILCRQRNYLTPMMTLSLPLVWITTIGLQRSTRKVSRSRQIRRQVALFLLLFLHRFLL